MVEAVEVEEIAFVLAAEVLTVTSAAVVERSEGTSRLLHRRFRVDVSALLFPAADLLIPPYCRF